MSPLEDFEALLRAAGHLKEEQSLRNAEGDAQRILEDRIGSNVGVYARNGSVLGLAARDCGLTTLPESIGRLTDVRQLDLTGNLLMTLPESLGRLVNLKRLYLDQNQLALLPVSLGNLTGLVELHLDDNQLAELPRLEKLDLRWNKLAVVPGWIQKLEERGCSVYR